MAMLIVLATPFVLRNMATDIFPEINIPVISIIWNYNGLPAQEMGQRIAGSERARPHHDGQRHRAHRVARRWSGITVIKVFFQPTANIQTAIAQVVAAMQTQVRQLPPGHHAAARDQVLGLEHPGDPARRCRAPRCRSSRVFDAAVNQLRPQLVTIPGVAIPFPYGGKIRVISVDLDMQALQARGLAPADVVNAVNTQNLILPSGTAKIGDTEYTVRMNASPDAIAGPERPAGAHAGRRHHLPARRGAGARRLLAADQHRAPGRRARRAALDPEERRRLDARHRRQPARRCCRARRSDPAAGREGHAALRPVGVREGGGQGRGRSKR